MSISTDTILAALIAFALTAVICPFLIPFLIRLKVGQTERKEGVQAHLKKAGTPTMGGIAILIAVLVTTLIFAPRYPRILPVLFLTLGFGIIGFVDDYLKVVLRRSDGLMPKQKMAGQIVVTAIFLLYVWLREPSCLDWRIPFTGGMEVGGMVFRIFATVIAFVAIIGTVNGVNFTDGLDGLCSSVTVVTALFFGAAAIRFGIPCAPAAGAVIGSLLAFLLYNVYPAKVFMGDTGALALGGFISSSALIMRMPLFIPIVGFIYMIEVISVMIQVGYFKKTHGKRFFRMAPIHHHFEKGGWSETRVVAVFTIVTVILSLAAWLGLG